MSSAGPSVMIIGKKVADASTSTWSSSSGNGPPYGHPDFIDEYEYFFGIYAQAKEAGCLDDLLALHGMTEEDIKPKRKKYHDEKYYRRRKVKNAETQTKKPETEHKDGEKENLTKALVKSTLHAQANPLLCLPAPAEPIAGPILEGLPMEGVPDRMNLIEAPKIEAPKTPSSLASEHSEPQEPLFAFPPGYYALGGAMAALTAGLGAILWAVPLLKREQATEDNDVGGTARKIKRSRFHSRDWMSA